MSLFTVKPEWHLHPDLKMSGNPCCQGDILEGRPTGGFTEDGAYLSSAPIPSNRAIVYLTDAFGLPLVNCKVIADNLSQRLECDVWIPDIFNGRPLFGVHQLPLLAKAGDKLTFWQILKMSGTTLVRLPIIIMNRPSVVDARINNFIKKIREQKKYENIGVIGYCFGGSCAARLGSRELVDSIVINHPGPVSTAEIKAIKVPTSWVMAEDDVWFPTSVQQQAEAIFAERNGKDDFVNYQFRQWKGTVHGFAARPVMSIPDIKAGYEGAFEQAVDWFNKTIPVAQTVRLVAAPLIS